MSMEFGILEIGEKAKLLSKKFMLFFFIKIK